LAMVQLGLFVVWIAGMHHNHEGCFK